MKIVALSVTFIIALSAAALGADTRSMTAARTSTPPVIDGVLEDIWLTSGPARDFGQYRPERGSTPYAPTEVYVLYDDQALYVGWVCHEPEPNRLVAAATVRDMFLNNDDSIDLMLDSTNSGTDCYDFMVNCRGTRYDGTVTLDGEDSGSEWDGHWEAKTSVGADAWYCEMVVPWASFRYDRGASSFGVNFLRFRNSVYEESYWVCAGTNPNRVSDFGRMEGFENLPAPKRFKFTPYVTARGQDTSESATYPYLEPTDGWEFEPRGGFDAEYRPGSNVNVMATILPDYAYIEADPAEINLQPTETYLTEKRPFFTENWDLFDLPYYLAYTRRLTEIAGGVKGSGRAGPVTVGAVDVMLKDDDPRFPDDNFAVARATYDIPGGHNVSIAGVGRRQIGNTLPADRPHFGEDAATYNNVGLGLGRFALPAGFYFTGTGAKSGTQGDEGDGYLYGASLSYPGLTDIYYLSYQEISDDFRADMSFLQPEEMGIRELSFYGRHEMQVNRAGVRSVTPDVDSAYDRAIDGDMVYWRVIPSLTVATRNDFSAVVRYYRGVDRRYLDIGLPEFRNNYALLSLGRSVSAWGGFELYYRQGEYYGEYYHNYGGSVAVIPTPIWVVEADANVVNPSSGDRFHVDNFKSTLTLAEDFFWRLILQGNSDARTAAGSTLWGWEFRPGSTAYLAYEQQRDGNDHFALVDQVVFLKVSYTVTI
ncbi:MAG: DUF5916 domain-containing protein [Candidatus Zixiibacteriota bacterium]|jgi:hypothetical protein